MSATLVLRTVKGSPLTNYEVDNNFSNINVYASELDANIGVISNLITSSKSNIVSAINEIAAESTTNVNITGGTIGGTTGWSGNVISITYGGTGATTATSARTALGLAIGANVQAWDADLDAIAALTKTDGNFIVGNGSTWVAESGVTARTSLGLGTISTQDSSSVSITGGSITGLSNLSGANATFSGNIVSGGIISAVDFNSTSDAALKENILDIQDPIGTLSKLNGKEFTWKTTGGKSYGLIAQEVEKILPSIVSETNGIKGINYINIIAYLIEAVKKLSEEIKQLQQK